MYESDEPCIRTTYRIGYWAGTLMNVAAIIWALVAGFLCYGSSWTPWAIMALAIAQLIVQQYGDWAMNRDRYNHTYAFLVMQFFSLVILVTLGASAIIDIPKVSHAT